MVHLRTTMMPMGLVGPELWRTNTLSIKPPRGGFSHVSSELDEMQKVGGDIGHS